MKHARVYAAWTCAMVVGLVAGIAARPVPQQTIADAIQSAAQPALPNDRMRDRVQMGFLLQAADCSGNLRMLHLLHRSRVREAIRLNVIWYVGPVADSVVIRGLLPEWTRQTPLRPATPSLLSQLKLLGHTSTPALVVLDQSGRVRLATQSPRSFREVAGLRRIIEGLTWIEEL